MNWTHSTLLGILVGIPIVMTTALAGMGWAVEPTSPVSAPKAPASSAGAGASHVREVQQALLAAGYDPGPIDGIMGPRTQAALRRYIAVPPPEVPSRPAWTLTPSRVSAPREAH